MIVCFLKEFGLWSPAVLIVPAFFGALVLVYKGAAAARAFPRYRDGR
jgi:hypothetical protein